MSVGEQVTDKVIDLNFQPENPIKQVKKIKILTISDHPLSPSGVGTQTKYFIDSLLRTGKFQFISVAGAVKHENYQPVKTEEWGDDWIIYPIDGYGNPDTIRSMLRSQRPDILWFMTDPRFYPWLWQMENEIRALVPMVYYHVWDNYPYPKFNKVWYDSTDIVVTISKLTSDIVKTVAPNVEEHCVPHTIPTKIFTKIPDDKVSAFRKDQLGLEDDDFLIFWNNRNARRKQSGSLIFWFKEFVEKLKKKNPNIKTKLMMHTEPKDPNGQDLFAICNELDLVKDKDVLLSTQKMPAEGVSMICNAADVTINIADAEGFGLSTFESLSCETPIIVTMTGGLQEQVTPLQKISEKEMLKRNLKAKSITEYEHGIGLEPSSKAIIGSQDVPYIYEDRLSGTQIVEALMKMYEYGPEKRNALGKAGRQYILENYGYEKFTKEWTDIMLEVHNKYGSWENRKNYDRWELKAV